jgi:uncharacterized protein YbjT (DUF2867 family)
MTILVTGATGNVGGSVVTQLLDRGIVPRVLTRDPGKAVFPAGVEAVKGDLAAPDTLPAALDGVEQVFLFAVGGSGPAFAAAARAAGVRKVVFLSSMAVVGSGARTNAIGLLHAEIEDAVRDAGLQWTFLRPGAFATNALGWAQQIRATGVVRAPHGGAAHTSIHEADIAAVGVAALTEDGHDGKGYSLTGPEALTQVDEVRLIGEAIGRPTRLEEISEEAFRAAVVDRMPPGFADQLLAYWRGSVGTTPEVLSTVEDVTGRPARTFRQWAQDHAADFQSGSTVDR